MRNIMRSPDTIITVAITPIMMMLLFVYVFGGRHKDRHGQLRQLFIARNFVDGYRFRRASHILPYGCLRM